MAISSQLRHVVFPRSRHSPPLDLTPVARGGHDERVHDVLSLEAAGFLRWLFERAGLDHRLYRPETLARRLAPCLRHLRARSFAHARQLVEEQPRLLTAAIEVMLVGVTSFFRDPDVFEWLAAEGLPALAEARGPRLYVYSAGCSDGAELYSVALQLAEAGRLKDSYLFGSDCRPEAIARARLGIYDANSLRGVSASRLLRHFVRSHGRWQLLPSIRLSVRWGVSDLSRGIEPGAWDLILFRNTAMYFRPQPLAELWPRFENALRPGGLLVLGRAERPSGTKRLFPVRPCVYRRERA